MSMRLGKKGMNEWPAAVVWCELAARHWLCLAAKGKSSLGVSSYPASTAIYDVINEGPPLRQCGQIKMLRASRGWNGLV